MWEIFWIGEKLLDTQQHVELHKFLNFDYTTFKNMAYH